LQRALGDLRNIYVNCQTEDAQPVPWYPPEVPPGAKPDSVYFSGVMAEMDRRLDATGLTVYITEDRDWLPSYGRDVVVVLIGDEFTRLPAYVGEVRAIFKNYAVRPALASNVFREPSWINLWSMAWHLRTWRYHIPARRRYVGRRARGEWVAPVWRLPVGVVDQLPLPIKPLAERRHDLFFAGSVGHHRAPGPKELINPKVLGRKAMVTEAERLRERHPELKVELATTAAFLDSMDADADAYSRNLMDSRIALVPRGTGIDTFRFWQALRYGCVAVVDTVPRDRWFYDRAPVVRLRGWGELEDVVVPLLADEARMRDLHERSLEWWRTRGSEEAVGAYMAGKLNAIPA
jgi:hypothetical protein